MKKCIIGQYGGLGDVLFSQGIVKHYSDLGYEVLWPVMPEILDSVNRLTTPAIFVNNNEDHPLKGWFSKHKLISKITHDADGNMCVPISESTLLVGGKIMQSKYTMCGLDYSLWKKYLNFNRNIEKENELYYNVLQIKDNEPFCLVNRNFGSDPIRVKNIKIHTTNMQIVEMQTIPNFNIFDWCKVFENMDVIETIDTSLMYILEKLELKNKTNFHVTSRHSTVKYQVGELFNIPWSYDD